MVVRSALRRLRPPCERAAEGVSLRALGIPLSHAIRSGLTARAPDPPASEAASPSVHRDRKTAPSVRGATELLGQNPLLALPPAPHMHWVSHTGALGPGPGHSLASPRGGGGGGMAACAPAPEPPPPPTHIRKFCIRKN